MTLLGKDHYEMIEFFERTITGYRLDKEPKELWSKGIIYQHGELNQLFKVFRQGVAYGQAVERAAA